MATDSPKSSQGGSKAFHPTSARALSKIGSFVSALDSPSRPAGAQGVDPADSRRAHRRVPAEAVVQLWVNSSVHDSHARTANISEEGMFVVTSFPLPVGTVARFEMTLPHSQLVCGFAEVVWLRPHFEGVESPNGMGLRYSAIRDDGKERLRDFVLAQVGSTGKSNASVRVNEQVL